MVVVNLLHKQFNVFDSVKNSKDVALLGRSTNNVVMLMLERAQHSFSFIFLYVCSSPFYGTLFHFVCVSFNQITNI